MSDALARMSQLASLLRDDGISLQDHPTELTYLVALERIVATDDSAMELAARWHQLKTKRGPQLLDEYRRLLKDLSDSPELRIRRLFANAQTRLTRPETLEHLVVALGEIDWPPSDTTAALYEELIGFLAKEHFTPRALVRCMVELTRPRPGERVLDPAAGSGGFLVGALEYVREHATNDTDAPLQIVGIESSAKIHRIATLNAALHGISGDIILGDALSPLGIGLAPADVVITNLPFGGRLSTELRRTDLSIATTDLTLVYLQHVYNQLRPGGRAAVIVPERVLFEGGAARKVRAELMDRCNLHTILRLSIGDFSRVSATLTINFNVLFFQRGHSDTGNTKTVWIYDLRSDNGRTLEPENLRPFMDAFGDGADGGGRRIKNRRFRCFDRETIRANGDNLDLSWPLDDRVTQRGSGAYGSSVVAVRGSARHVDFNPDEERERMGLGFFPAWAQRWGEDRYGTFASFVVAGVEQRMRWVPAGTLTMGVVEGDSLKDGTFTRQEVTLSEGFWIADTPCTQALWEVVMGNNPSHFTSLQRPVEQVAWDDVQTFLSRLNDRAPGLAASLPRESQWEYACRGGTMTGTYAGSLHQIEEFNAPVLHEIAWYGGNSGVDWDLDDGVDSSKWEGKQFPHVRAGTRKIGLKRPNAWGLYDMLGNVWEWCQDMHEIAPPPGVKTPKPMYGRAARGGCWASEAHRVQAGWPMRFSHRTAGDYLGFRIVRSGRQAPHKAELEGLHFFARTLEQAEDWPALARVLEQLANLTMETREQAHWLTRAAQVYLDHGTDGRESVVATRRLLERARAVSVESSEARAVLLPISFYQGDWERTLELAIELRAAAGDAHEALIYAALVEAFARGKGTLARSIGDRHDRAVRQRILWPVCVRILELIATEGPLPRLDALLFAAAALCGGTEELLDELSAWAAGQPLRAGLALGLARLNEAFHRMELARHLYQIAAFMAPNGPVPVLITRLPASDLPRTPIHEDSWIPLEWRGALREVMLRLRDPLAGVRAKAGISRPGRTPKERLAVGLAAQVVATWRAALSIDFNIVVTEQPLVAGIGVRNFAKPTIIVNEGFVDVPEVERRYRLAYAAAALATGLGLVVDDDPIGVPDLLDALMCLVEPRHEPTTDAACNLIDTLAARGLTAAKLDADLRRSLARELDHWRSVPAKLEQTMHRACMLIATRLSGHVDGALGAMARDRGLLTEPGKPVDPAALETSNAAEQGKPVDPAVLETSNAAWLLRALGVFGEHS